MTSIVTKSDDPALISSGRAVGKTAKGSTKAGRIAHGIVTACGQ